MTHSNKILVITSICALAACSSERRPELPDAAPDAPIPENTYEKCTDKIDNDGDGATDCDDPDCWAVILDQKTKQTCSMTIGNLQRGRYPTGTRTALQWPMIVTYIVPN